MAITVADWLYEGLFLKNKYLRMRTPENEMQLNPGKTFLFLDDVRPTPNGFYRVYDYKGFTGFILKNGMPDFISFDHDLGEGRSGFDCAKFLVEYCLDHHIPRIHFQVHSQNPVGKQNIESLLHNFNKIMNSGSLQ